MTNQLIEWVDRDETSVISRRSIPASIVTPTASNKQAEMNEFCTPLAVSQAQQATIYNYAGDRGGWGGREKWPRGVLGTKLERDDRLTQPDGWGKKIGKKNYCQTHGWDVGPDHNHSKYMWPDSCHDALATVEDTKNGCQTYKHLSHKVWMKVRGAWWTNQ